MKKRIVTSLIILLFSTSVFAQNKSGEKTPTQKEMQEMMKEAERMLQQAKSEMSEEERRLLDSLGVQLPDLKKSSNQVSGVSDKQLAEAWEEEERVVPKKDLARIAAIPKGLTNAKMGDYLKAVKSKINPLFDKKLLAMGEKLYEFIQTKEGAGAGNMAAALWVAGKPQLSMYLLGQICQKDPGNTDNISNYAAMLSMLGGQQLAIPILNNLNARFPKNSTILNNLGQAWLGLGDLIMAEKYLDTALILFPLHPQANLAKAAIQESRGQPEKAKESIKKSTNQAFTDDKEARLAKLGYKIKPTEFRFPRRPKNDPLNLGGFQPPDFPITVQSCVTLGQEWIDYIKQIDIRIAQLEHLKDLAADRSAKAEATRMNADMAAIKIARAAPGTTVTLSSAPLFSKRASERIDAYMLLFQGKLNAYMQKLAGFYAGEAETLRQQYEEQIRKIRKEDNEQTGEGKPNENFCPVYQEAANKYLKALNSKLRQYYIDGLQLKKEYLNELAYFNMFMLWPETFEAVKLGYQIEWLKALKNGLGSARFGSSFPYMSITEYNCDNKPAEPKHKILQNFDDVACNYKSELKLPFIKITSNCSRVTSEFDLLLISYVRKDDFERAEGDTYIESSIKISAETGVDSKEVAPGPIKVEAKLGWAVELEMDRKGVKDINLIGVGKAGVGTSMLDDGLEKAGGTIAGNDIISTTVELGVEARVSILSGKGAISSVSSVKAMNGIKLAEW